MQLRVESDTRIGPHCAYAKALCQTQCNGGKDYIEKGHVKKEGTQFCYQKNRHKKNLNQRLE